jgi:phosphatidylinositol-3-phosphatase
MRPLLTRALCLLTLCLSPLAVRASDAAPTATGLHAIHHVFVIVLENEPYSITFGTHSPAPYLAHALPAKGAMLRQYYGVGHNSLDNYIAMVSGQAPNRETQHDCPVMTEFKASGPLNADGQLPGHGCVYPATVKTVADQLEAAGLSWKGYMEDMGADPKREAATCGHVPIGAKDYTNHASPTDEYADKHNPFVYFHSIIDDAARCHSHVVNLDALQRDLAHIDTTPNLAYITPGLCHDGHDAPCANGEPGGLVSANAFLKTWVPRIMASPAFRKDGLLVITFDEGADGRACCNEQPLPGGPKPGKYGPGGGRIGTVLLSPLIRPGTVSDQPYNHYSLLRSIEDAFGLKHLGYAGANGLRPFGKDIFTAR